MHVHFNDKLQVIGYESQETMIGKQGVYRLEIHNSETLPLQTLAVVCRNELLATIHETLKYWNQ